MLGSVVIKGADHPNLTWNEQTTKGKWFPYRSSPSFQQRSTDPPGLRGRGGGRWWSPMVGIVKHLAGDFNNNVGEKNR